ncbi:MAG: type VI secretion system baseplate subunit TssE [Paracoccaceae bacterium]
MADKTLAERLQPSLLDRLTDDNPGDQKETRESRVIDLSRLRDIVQRDLAWLLNTTNLEGIIDEEEYPHVAKSVVNYGVKVVSGEFSTSKKAELIRRSIQQAISLHEPRIIEGSVDVILRPEEAKGKTAVALDIVADMWAQPVPLELYLRSSVDVATGEVTVERRM